MNNSVIVMVNGDKAARWLDQSEASGYSNFRRLDVKHRNRICSDMISGRWRNNGDPIRIGPSGELVDGQNRLSALVKASKLNPSITIEMSVIFNFPLDTEIPVDRDRQGRTLSQTLRNLGSLYTNETGPTAMLVWNYLNLQKKRMGGSEAVSFSDTLSSNAKLTFIECSSGLHSYSHSIALVKRLSSTSKYLKPVALLAAIHWLISVNYGVEVGDSFIEGLSLNASSTPGSPVTRLKEYLYRKESSRDLNPTNPDLMRTAIKAFDMWRANLTCSRLGVTPTEFSSSLASPRLLACLPVNITSFATE